MSKAKRTILIAMLVCAGFVPLYAARPARSKGKLKYPTALELLDQYAAGQEKLRSFTAKVETSREGFSSGTQAGRGRRFRIYAEADVRFDGRRASFRKASWGQISRDDYYEKDKPYYLSALWDGTTFVHYRPQREGWNFLMIKQPKGEADAAKTYENMLKGNHAAIFFLGYFYPWSARIDSLLREADTISVRPDMAKLGQTRCYVIDAAKDKAQYTVWIDPEHGYHTARIEIERRQRDAQDLKLFSCVFKNVRFQQFDNVWVPVAADMEDRFVYPNGQYTNDTYHIVMKETALNPDHDNLGSFLPDDIKDGSTVLFIDGVHVRDHTWQGGQVLDKSGLVVLDCRQIKTGDSAKPQSRTTNADGSLPSPSSAVASAGRPGERRPGLWDMLRRSLVQPAAPDPPHSPARVVHFPDDRSIGRVFIVEPKQEEGFMWHGALGGPYRLIPEARGDIEVPPGSSLRLDIMKDARAAAPALRQLKPDDVQILHFYYAARGLDDRTLEAIAHLSGLKALFASHGSFSEKGLAHLARLKHLKALNIPGSVSPEAIEQIRKLKALEYLNLSGNGLTDDKLAVVGQMPWLMQLSIAQLNQTRGLRHIANLKSLRYLNLQAVRDPRLDLNLAYIAGLTELEEIDFEDSIIGDAGLAHLRNMKKLRKLDLFSNPSTGRISESGLAHLTYLTALEDIRLPYGAMTDKGLTHLARLDSLWRLNLSSAQLTDAGLAVLPRMKSLRDVELSCPGITDAGLAAVCRCAGLKSLTIGRCGITDAGLAKIGDLTLLEYLSVKHASIRGTTLGVLSRCPSLRELDLMFMNLDAAVIDHITAASSIESLNLYNIGVRITDDVLRRIAGLKALKRLDILAKDASEMPITDAGIRHLAGLKKLEYVWLNYCAGVTDAALKHIEGLTSLRELRLDKSRITKAGVNRLKAAIPDISVTVPATMQSAGQGPPSSSTRRTGRGNSTGREQTRRR